jgi:protein-tyrosine phosphatase
MTNHRRIFSSAVLGLAIVAVSCKHITSSTDAKPASQSVSTSPPASRPIDARFPPINSPALPNARRVTAKVISGGLPDGERGFEALQKLGVKTVIDVDGIMPQVELAHTHGMHYVHIPFGYDGVPVDKGEAIAKAIKEMPGPIYVHCHHGQQRSAAATAVACVENGTLPPDEAEDVLKTFGTGANYTGLWASARAARPIDPSELAALKVHYVERAKLPPLAKVMVNVDGETDALKADRKAHWSNRTADNGARHDALMLEELLREVGRSDAAAAKPEEFQSLLKTAVGNATELRTALAADPFEAGRATTRLDRLNASCTACHKIFRDVHAR